MTRPSAGHFERAALVLGLGAMVFAVTAFQCPTADPVSRCPVQDVNGFNANGLSASTTIPDRCPVRVNISGEQQSYAGVVSAPGSKVSFSTLVSVSFYDARSFPTGEVYVDNFIPSGDAWAAEPEGIYRAALAGFDNLAYALEDRGVLRSELLTQVSVEAWARLPYTRAVEAIVAGPVVVSYGSSSTFVGSASSNATPPLTYRWYRDGGLVGSASQVTLTFNTSATMTLVVTSADGRQGSKDHAVDVSTGSGGGGGGEPCWPQLRQDSLAQPDSARLGPREGALPRQEQPPPCDP